MSYAGIQTFNANLKLVMVSPAFKNATQAEQLIIGDKLLRSRFGISLFSNIQDLKLAVSANQSKHKGVDER